ncbi:adenosylcobinamide-GDP ribazoletransferase [Stakelama sp. CBK3Z-3]|uniref:Adenosylcobinamide-GDP ribazoletransferase n=1 Tax=Stakelama flava TaxID=2860338 RepID=A0ABS6XLD7_9SPHN|nr:adenosylcobinamide-GDP ribazoletransferase [Stakelama flava]MBW4330211.1 adenosylcobinamide-GDP ribazoletransferase [Stakelama flava]
MRRLAVAIRFLTRLPTPRVAMREGDFAAAIRLYPLVGMVIGALVAAAGWGAAQVDPWLGALAALGVWVGVTGALHLDGLGDVADGLGAAHGDRTRMLDVMRDPHIGSFGVIAIVLQLATKLVLLHLLLPGDWPALIAIPAAARLAPLVWARMLPSLRSEGLGASITGATRARDLIGWALVLAGGCAFLPLLLATPLLLIALGWWFRVRIGGMTGDVHGAGIELFETGLLVTAVLA